MALNLATIFFCYYSVLALDPNGQGYMGEPFQPTIDENNKSSFST